MDQIDVEEIRSEYVETENEHCWVLMGKMGKEFWYGRFELLSEGSPVQVEFDHEQVDRIEKNGGFVIGWLHTHPGFSAHYSDRDRRTAQAWSISLGRPVLCAILGVDGLKCWWFDDEYEPVLTKGEILDDMVLVGEMDERLLK